VQIELCIRHRVVLSMLPDMLRDVSVPGVWPMVPAFLLRDQKQTIT
jgi:hypothetical protein